MRFEMDTGVSRHTTTHGQSYLRILSAQPEIKHGKRIDCDRCSTKATDVLRKMERQSCEGGSWLVRGRLSQFIREPRVHNTNFTAAKADMVGDHAKFGESSLINAIGNDFSAIMSGKASRGALPQPKHRLSPQTIPFSIALLMTCRKWRQRPHIRRNLSDENGVFAFWEPFKDLH